MTNQQILKKAIQKAIDGGWTWFDWLDANDFEWEVSVDREANGSLIVDTYSAIGDFGWHPNIIIFNHDFAKSLWGEGWAWFTEGQSGDTLPSGNYRNYIGHLANMVVADDPIEYLEHNL